MTKKAKIWLLICCVVLGVGLFVANVLLAVKFPNCGSNIFTAISGWVSGIATIILGIIAVVQSKKYKEENDRFTNYQKQRDWRIEQKELIKAYLENIEKIFYNVKEYQYSKLIQNWSLNLLKDELTADNIIYDEILSSIKDDMIYATVNSIYYFDGIEELLDVCCGYTYKLRVLLKRFPELIKKKEFKHFDEVKDIYQELNRKFNQHIFQVQLFIAMIMSNGIYEDIEKELENKRDKQKQWIQRMEVANEEMSKKWKN